MTIKANRPADLANPADRILKPVVQNNYSNESPIEKALRVFEAKKSGNGYMAKCPAHSDRKASLAIKEGSDGKVLLYCHAGCNLQAILDAANLSPAELFNEDKPAIHLKSEPFTTYDYSDETGKRLFQAVRFFPKGFSQRRQVEGVEGWVWGLTEDEYIQRKNGDWAKPKKEETGGVRRQFPECRRVLYRLPELLAANSGKLVFIVEGEKDADVLAGLGLVATTNPQGAGKWREDYSGHLIGREVVIIPDNDQTGRDHAEKVAVALHGKARSIKILPLAGLPDNGDVSDWLNAGGTLDELQRLVKSAPAWSPDNGHQAAKSTLIHSVRMDTVEIKPIDWLWINRIPCGTITIFEGEEGIGKSTLLCAIATVVSTGNGPADFMTGTPGNVLWLSAEEDLARVLKPRLIDAGADCGRVYAISEPFSFDEKGLLALKEQIVTHSPKIVVIDPIFAYLQGDANRGNDARKLTNELRHIAETYQVAILLVRHIGKSKGNGDPRAAGLYSIEWRAAARSVLLIGADPNNRNKRAVTQTKNNYGPLSPALGYTIESSPDSVSGAKFFWTGESDLTAERILATVDNDEKSKLTSKEAEDFIRDALAKGERLAKDIQIEARNLGISTTTLNRTKRRMGVVSRPEGGGFSKTKKTWYWSLTPLDDHAAALDGQMSNHDHLTLNHSDKNSYSNGLALDGQSSKCDHLTEYSDHLTNAPSTKKLDGWEEFEI